MEIIPTIVPSTVQELTEKSAILGAFAHTLHIDIADGVFASNTTWLPQGEALPSGALYEVHLMAEHPQKLGISCIQAGAKRVIAHVEAFAEPEAVQAAMGAWKAAGAEVGFALLLETPLTSLDPHIAQCDVVQLMTIAYIGAQGASFDETALSRIAEIHTRYPELTIAVDGGVNLENIAQLAEAGATRFCVGATLARAENPASTYNELLKAANAVS